MPAYTISRAPDARSSASTIFRNVASSSRPNSFSPSQVPANKAGNPIRNSLITSGVIAPLAPIHNALMAKIATATG